MQKATFRDNKLWPMPEVQEPNASFRYCNPEQHDLSLVKYAAYLSTVLPVPESLRHLFKEGEVYEEGRDYRIGFLDPDRMDSNDAMPVAIPIEPKERVEEMIWLSEKPDFKKECVFITATKYERNNEPLYWDYSVWQIKKLDGETESGEYGWYWGLLNGDGEEWGPLEELAADRFFILAAPPVNTHI